LHFHPLSCEVLTSKSASFDYEYLPCHTMCVYARLSDIIWNLEVFTVTLASPIILLEDSIMDNHISDSLFERNLVCSNSILFR
jgi:hypothetical protein